MKTIIFALLIFFSSHLLLFSQNLITIYPLQVGNVFVFKMVSDNSLSYVRSVITKDTVIKSKRYFSTYNYPFYFRQAFLFRFDTVNGRFLKYDSSVNCRNFINESLIDSLWVSLNDSVHFCSILLNKCTDTNSVSRFGISCFARKVFWLQQEGIHYGYEKKIYANKFGLLEYEYGGGGVFGTVSTDYSLVGCLIDNVLYGDTTSVVPEKFSLSQNYPNPFNPTATIKYDLPKDVKVSIKIYDILGREVATLVNEVKQAGYYQTVFDGTNLASGVYFYHIEAGTFVDSKKMVLIK